MNSDNIKEIAKRFLAAWATGKRPELTEYVAKADSSIRDDLTVSLVEIDVEQRTISKESVAAKDYHQLGPAAVSIATQRLSELQQIEQPTVAPGPDFNVKAENKAGFSGELETMAPDVVSGPGEHSTNQRFLHFELLEELARGGMGVVYRARDTRLNRIVALKMILSGQLASEEERVRFNLEAEAAANLDHRCITPIYEIGEHGGQPYFAMKLIEGGSLADHLDRYVNDPRKSARLVADVADAVHHAHQRGTLHRDLKPNNILLDQDEKPLITDFGLAKLTNSNSEVTRTGAMMGTPGYMPPEQAASGKDVTTAADIYSLGAILFATLTGRPPFQGNSAMETVMQAMHQDAPKPSSINSRSPIELELIAMKCLDRDPKKRYVSAADVANDLENWLCGEPVSVRAPSVATLASQWMRRNIRMAATSLLIGIMLAALATPFCLMGFNQSSLPGTIYDELPSASRPLLAGFQLGLPKTEMGTFALVLILTSVFLASSAGAIAVAWLKPDSMNESVSIGIISGVAVAITLFLLIFGWLFSGDSMGVTNNDLNLLVMRGSSTGPQTVQNDERILWRYPDLVNVEKSQWGDFLKRKILEDTALMTVLGNIVGAIMSALFFIPVALAAAYYFRLCNRHTFNMLRLIGHLEFVIPAVILSFVLIWFIFTLATEVLPNGFLAGAPKPRYLQLLVGIVLSGASMYVVWNFKPVIVRLAFHAVAVAAFAYMALPLLDNARLGSDVTGMLADGDYESASQRMLEQSRAAGVRMFYLSASVVLAARSGNHDLHDKMHEKLLRQVLDFEPHYDTSATNLLSAPALLESLLLTPKTSNCLKELQRLVEFVEKFATAEAYGPNRYFVLALAKYREGEYQDALELLNKIAGKDAASRNEFQADLSDYYWQYLDDHKSFALKAMIYHKLDRPVNAIEELHKLEITLDHLRQWKELDNRDHGGKESYWWRRNTFYVLDVLRHEAIAELASGYGLDNWREQYLDDAIQTSQTSIEESADDVQAIVDAIRGTLIRADLSARDGDLELAKQNFLNARDLVQSALEKVDLQSRDYRDVELLALRSINDYFLWPKIFQVNRRVSSELDQILTKAKYFPYFASQVNERIARYQASINQTEQAIEWYNRFELASRNLPANFDWGGIVTNSQALESHEYVFSFQPWNRSERIASARTERAVQIFELGNSEEAIELARKTVSEFPNVARWKRDLVNLLHRSDPSQATDYIESLETTDSDSWKSNAQLIKWTTIDSTGDLELRKKRYRKQLEKHLANSGIDDAVKQRIRSRKPWRFVGPFESGKRAMVEQELLATDSIHAETLEEIWASSSNALEAWGAYQSKVLAPLWSNNVDISAVFGFSGNAAGSVFGIAKLQSGRQKVRLIIGNDAGIQVWLNGRSEYQAGDQHPYNPEQEVIEVDLNEGLNNLVIRVDMNTRNVLFKLEVEDLAGWPANVKWEEPN